MTCLLESRFDVLNPRGFDVVSTEVAFLSPVLPVLPTAPKIEPGLCIIKNDKEVHRQRRRQAVGGEVDSSDHIRSDH
jgi:hypothetical protein